QWLTDSFDVGDSGSTPGQPDDNSRPEGTTIDSQTFGPGESYTADIVFGAGSKPGTVGDSIFHCHLYPHFAEGFWSLFRVHDVLEDGSGTTPDGIRVRALQPLPDRAAAADLPPLPDEFNPGFPRFIPGEFGWRAPQPLNGVSEANGGDDDAATPLIREDLSPATRIVAEYGLYEELLEATQTISNDSAAANEVQSISNDSLNQNEVQSVSNDATGGTFTLTFDGLTTGPLDYNASAEDVQDALEALLSIDDVTVGSAAAQAWDVEFVNPGGQNVPELTATDALSSGSTTILTTTEGTDGGTFTLTFDGQTTGPLDYNASAEDVQDALETLSNIVDVYVTQPAAQNWEVQLGLWSEAPSLLLAATDALSTGSSTITSSRPDLGDPVIAETAYKLARERSVALISHNPGYHPVDNPLPIETLTQPLPGSPLVDPCPPGTREITYNVSVIQLDIVYNDADWHDPQGRMLVLNKDVDAVVSGEKKLVPFFFRVNAGDCINFNLTNRLPNYFGYEDFMEIIQTNMVGEHIHLVKFDVNGSDGSTNGWNYQQAAFTEEQARFNEDVLAGTQYCGSDTFSGLDLVSDGCRLPHPDTIDPLWVCGDECPMGQTLSARWYADYELRTVFTHDHHFPAEDQNRGYFGALVVEPAGMDVRDPFTGEWMQPINDPAHGPVCGSACEGTAVGTHLDIIGPSPNDDFREYSLAIQDFVSLYRPCQDPTGVDCSSFIPGQEPINPPEEPELYPDDDPGVFGINYRNAPLPLRNTVNGNPVDPAYWFSSRVHGDPPTPKLLAYAGDKIRMRLIQGAQEEQHRVQIHGTRWRDEPDDPGSPLVGS
ncbi:MAG: hypothetical protein V3U39_01670, partial [Acidimicrobiia bacterium]